MSAYIISPDLPAVFAVPESVSEVQGRVLREVKAGTVVSITNAAGNTWILNFGLVRWVTVTAVEPDLGGRLRFDCYLRDLFQ